MPVIEPTEILSPNDRSRVRFATRGVLSSRLLAFMFDFVAIAILWAVSAVALGFLGFLTFGLAWLALPVLWQIVALFYNGLTVSGPGRGTWGMRIAGIELIRTDGTGLDFLSAAVHAVLFYVSVVVLTPLVLVLGMVRNDRRLLHDLLLGSVAVRRIS
jgi:uncharacterized RDD family membrane protein YckC